MRDPGRGIWVHGGGVAMPGGWVRRSGGRMGDCVAPVLQSCKELYLLEASLLLSFHQAGSKFPLKIEECACQIGCHTNYFHLTHHQHRKSMPHYFSYIQAREMKLRIVAVISA